MCFGFLFLAACLFYYELRTIGKDELTHAFLPVLGVTVGLLGGSFGDSFFRGTINQKRFGLCLLACLLGYIIPVTKGYWWAHACLPFLAALCGLYYSGFRQELPGGRRFVILSGLAVLVYGGVIVMVFLGLVLLIFLISLLLGV